jgi:transcriptional regulator of met regulon
MPKSKRARPKLGLVDPKRQPTYDQGGRRPLTEKKLVPVTLAIDASLYDEIETVAAKFINPKTLKSYGVSSVARITVELNLKLLKSMTEENLLYYVPPGEKKGAVGRFPLEDAVKVTLLIKREHVECINAALKKLKKKSRILGTTTVIRWILRERIGDVRLTDLYDYIPESHKEIMDENGWTPRRLLDLAKASKPRT